MKRTVFGSLVICLLLSACTKPPTKQAAPPQQPHTHVQQTQQQAPQTAPRPTYNQSSQATADRLVQLASRVRHVQSATAVVIGKYAVVGITIDPKLDRPEVGVIKYSVAEALKEDPQGASAMVTANPAIVQRLREMSDDIRKGHPVSGFTDELADIVGRIMPQMPRDVKTKEQIRTHDKEQRITPDNKPHPRGNEKINANRNATP